MCWRSSPDRERPMVRLTRSTAGLNICAGLLWGSVTSPTTSPGVCSSPVASDRFYTLNYDDPEKSSLLTFHGPFLRKDGIPHFYGCRIHNTCSSHVHEVGACGHPGTCARTPEH